jgi:HAMP domain-containing protein
MKLLPKVNLILIVVLGCGWAIAAYLSRQFLMRSAREQVVNQAQLMMESAMAIRTYTSQDVKPLLEKTQEHTIRFLPETVPAFGATTTFALLRKHYPDYTYREATLNPTNPTDRAVAWEADIINDFRNHPDKKMLMGERSTPTGPSLWLSQPLVANPPCLQCHGQADKAPRALLRVYGRDNGFGWKPFETIGAQIVSVPESVPIKLAGQEFNTLLIYMGISLLLTIVVIDTALVFAVIRPVGKLAEMADRVSKGETDLPELPARGRDEISNLTAAFNRMYRSLAKALKLLES